MAEYLFFSKLPKEKDNLKYANNVSANVDLSSKYSKYLKT